MWEWGTLYPPILYPLSNAFKGLYRVPHSLIPCKPTVRRKQHDVGVMVDGQASKIGAENVGSKGTFSKSMQPMTLTVG